LLSAVSLQDFIAASPDDYIGIAAAAAQNLDALGALRGSLRERMRRSPLLQAKDYARAVEDAYLRILSRRRVIA
jgi:predicted O-linked N-acetylglucosamine transferase (SPINDLY family)